MEKLIGEELLFSKQKSISVNGKEKEFTLCIYIKYKGVVYRIQMMGTLAGKTFDTNYLSHPPVDTSKWEWESMEQFLSNYPLQKEPMVKSIDAVINCINTPFSFQR